MKRKIEESREFGQVVKRAEKIARLRGNTCLDAGHILLALLADKNDPATQALGEVLGIILLSRIGGWYEQNEPISSRSVWPDFTFQSLLSDTWFQVISRRGGVFWPEHIFLAVIHGGANQDHLARMIIHDCIDRVGIREIRARLEESLEQRSKQPAQAS